MRGKYKLKTFWLGFVLNFVLQIISSFILFEFAGNIHDYLYFLVGLLLNAILFSIICLFVKEKVQWILGSVLGSVISAVLITILFYFTVSYIDPPAPVYVPVE